VLAAALARQDYRIAAAAARNLVIDWTRAGRLGEALQLAEQTIGYSQRAGLGPWTQLLDEVRRLQVLNFMGQPGKAIAEVQRLRAYMETLRAISEQPEKENVPAWSSREELLGTGREAALKLELWEEALEMNAAAVASMRARGAPEAEIARARFSDHGPMIVLGHVDEALEMLKACREVFKQAHDIEMLGMVFDALAAAEGNRGHGDVAVDLAREGLRYSYLAENVDSIRISHHTLGEYLRDLAGQPGTALAHHLAAALLGATTGAEGAVDDSALAAAEDLKADSDTPVPADVPDLCRRVAAVPGVDLSRLIAGLAQDPQAMQRTLEELIRRAHGLR
jgi:hypothetical protein